MASTIKLKNSNTAGNAPSSLEQGEVAINVADGNLFYGDGSSVLQNFALNNITSSGNISSSANIIASNVDVDLAVTFNGNRRLIYNNIDDNLVVQDSSLKVNSHITASGNISASGLISLGEGANFIGGKRFITSTDGFEFRDGTLKALGGIIGNNITASGNISSSATIIGNIISGSTISGSFVGDGSGISGITVSNENLTVDNATLQLDSGTTFDGSAAKTISIKDGGVDSDALAADITVTSLTATNITASGNISSSETVFTTNIATPDIPSGNQTGTPITIKAGRGFGSGATAGALFLRTSQGMGTGLGGDITLQPGGGGSSIEAKSGSLNLNSPKININGAITSSGNISSSGNIITNEITASGINLPSDNQSVTFDNATKLIGDHSVDGFQIRTQDATPIVFKTNGNNIRATIAADGEATFAGVLNSTKVNTGQGDTEVHLMDQNIRTSDNVEFVNITATGNTVLGNASTDTHTITGHITASGNISSSGNVAGLSGSFSHIALENNSRIVAKNNPSQTFIELQNDDGFKLEANNTPVFSAFSNGIVFNENGTAQADFRIESDNDTHIFFVDSGNDKVAIGTDTVGSSLLTVDGDITATDITATDITATDITASGTISASIIKSNNIIGDTSQNTQLFVDGAITASNDVSASNFIGAPIQLVTHAWYSAYAAADWGLDKLTNGDDNFGWADRAWDDAVDKADADAGNGNTGTFTNNDFNKGVRINHDIIDIELVGTLRPNSSVTQLNYYIYKGTPYDGGNTSTITFLASASSNTTTTSRPNDIYITGSTGLQADKGDYLYIFANADLGSGNMKGSYTVTAKTRK